MCTKRASRGWRRGNGFEPPSRVVHTRALPIELPCQSPSRLALNWVVSPSGEVLGPITVGTVRRLGFERRFATSSEEAIIERRSQMSGCRRKIRYSALRNLWALPCNALRFVRCLTDVVHLPSPSGFGSGEDDARPRSPECLLTRSKQAPSRCSTKFSGTKSRFGY